MSNGLEILKERLRGDLIDYKSIPFWSWNNALDEEELVKQIEDMYSAGIGGFIMHARTGLKDEYLGEKWFSCIGACLKKARELGMHAWVYDENGWPSGFVGGKLLENYEFRARFLELERGAYDESAYACFVREEARGFVRVTEKRANSAEYYNIYLRVSPANTDILNPAVVEAFLQETHEQYYKRFKESFGRELVGFFTDEPQVYRQKTPYSPVLDGYFAADGEDIKDGLIWLFVQEEQGYPFRAKYYALINELYVQNFYKRIYDWCEAHGCKLTGHSIEEQTLAHQMIGGGAVMPTYEFEHIPAIDWLALGFRNELSPRQIGSSAAQLGKKQVLTETFACCGYDVTPKALKSVAETQYFYGVNKTCQHLYAYSVAGKGRIDHPPVFSPHGNWFEEFKTFNDYFTRLGYIIANTKEQVDIAVLHPIRSTWLNYLREGAGNGVAEEEESLAELMTTLRKRGITYHFVDEALLKRHGSVEGKALRVGACKYEVLLLPKMRSLESTTYALLQGYEGKLCMLGEIERLDGKRAEVKLRGNCSLEEVLSLGKIPFVCEDGNTFVTARAGEVGEYLFVKNISMLEESRAKIEGASKRYKALDLETLETRAITDEFTFGVGESVILLRDDGAKTSTATYAIEKVTQAFSVKEISENFLVMDYVQIAKGEGAFGRKYPVAQIFDLLLREDYKGKLSVRQTFTVKEKLPLTLIMERAELQSATLNGKALRFTQTAFDRNFVQACADDFVRAGENELVYSFDFWQHDGVHFALFDPLATESLKNCLYFDTSIEPTYLKGDFVVEEGVIVPRTGLPAMTGELQKAGYPFFKGIVTYAGSLYYDGKSKATLALGGNFLVAKVKANGKEISFVLDKKKEITSLLKQGRNELEIVVKSSLRNLFGPHHFKKPFPLAGASPYHFEFRGKWGEDTLPDEYVEEYQIEPFGLDEITLIKE